MTIKKPTMTLLLLSLILLSATSINSANQKNLFRLQLPRQGDQFIYKGIVKWGADPNPRQKGMIWPVDVVDVITRGSYHIAKLSGFPDDLVGFYDFDKEDPTPQERYYIINKQTGDIYISDFLPSLTRSALKQLKGEQIYLNLAGPPRGQKPYSDWVLESKDGVNINDIKGITQGQYLKYAFGERTISGVSIIDFVPGIGVIAYKYVHNGSISEIDMKLIEIKHSNR
jgi:hypothetical protein